MSYSSRHAEWKVVYEDPPNIVVTRNQSDLRWSYDPSQNRITDISRAQCHYYILVMTGWHIEYDSTCYIGYLNPAEYVVKSSRTFDNDTFVCPPWHKGATTWAHNHRLVGTGTGQVRYSSDWGKSGPCAYLLSGYSRITIR